MSHPENTLKQIIEEQNKKIAKLNQEIKFHAWALEILHEKLGFTSDQFSNLIAQRMRDNELI
jgi:hypothetical protein